MVIVMEVDAKSQLLLDVENLREYLGDQPTGPILSTAVRIAGIVLEAAHHNSPPLEWDKILGQAAVRLEDAA